MNQGRLPEVTVYTFEQKDGTRLDLWTFDAQEADQYARDHSLMLIENTYTWEDSELAEDYTGSDEDEEEEENDGP